MNEKVHQTYKFIFSGQFKCSPIFSKDLLYLATESDRPYLESIDFFEEGEIDQFLRDSSIYILRIDGEYIGLGTMLFPFWREDMRGKDLRDIGMYVAENHRGKGFGRSIVQNLISICMEAGNTPIAECLTDNHTSRLTLESAGFILNQEL